MRVLGPDTFGAFRVERREQPVDAFCTESSDLGVEARAKRLVPTGRRDDPLEEPAQIHPRAAGDDRHAPTREDRGDRGVGVSHVLGEGVITTRVGDVEQPMPDTLPLLARRLGGCRVKASVDLEGIAADDLACEAQGDERSEL